MTEVGRGRVRSYRRPSADEITQRVERVMLWFGLALFCLFGMGGLYIIDGIVHDGGWLEIIYEVWWIPAGLTAFFLKVTLEQYLIGSVRIDDATSRDPDQGSRGASENIPEKSRPRFPPPSKKRYQVVSYDVSEEPAGEAFFRLRGEFDSANEALACARAVVDRDLEGYSSEATADAMYGQFSSFGEGALIWGAPKVEFNPYAYARERANQVFAQTKNWKT